ncbi:lymphoid-specific helicase-like isoform X2 [Mercenaria mercenaria]|uniref:lymphoid-specific helicase-like isoform X2 n=1 Tax=Mercenaria mercenaria TaxID=6596 RepID=UPI00234F00A8|nr:lymphoid-specific helicase-like isoform X2 [Mercenaria mercenaria]
MSTLCEVSKESPCKPSLEEAAVPDEDAHSRVGSETDLEILTTRDGESPLTVSSFPASEMITQSVMEEEGKLEKEGEAEEEEELRKRKELWLHMEQETKEERYRRLQCLLMKSNMYTEYLLRRMERQREEEKKRRERILKKLAKEEQKKKEETLKTQQNTEISQDSDVKAKSDVVKSEGNAAAADTESSPKPEPKPEPRKTRGKLKLRAPVPKSTLSGSSTPAGSQSTPNTPGIESGNTPKIESAKEESMDTCTSPASNVEGITGSPSSDKENRPTGKQTRTSLKPPEVEDAESKKGRKRKNLDYNEQSPQSAKLLTHFFQPSSKKRKVEEEENTEIKIEKKAKKEVELFKGHPDIDTDGKILRPALLTGGELRNYQVEGLNWLKVLFENGVNGMLADEMGLGKTIQCVALLCQIVTMGAHGPFMVVAPLSTLPNWKMEFKRFAPHLPVVFYHGSKDERAAVVKQIRKKHRIMENVTIQPVVITSYEIAMIDRPVLKNFDWTYMIVDEGHRIKNKNCRLIRELKQYKNTHRLLLTGTPLQNNLSELWSLLNFLLPEIFDDLGSFETWFDVEMISGEAADEAIIEEERKSNILGMLHQILTPFMLRRVKADVDLEIPPKKELLVYAPLSKEQLEFYETTVDRTIFQKLKGKEEEEEIPVDLYSTERPKRGRKSITKKAEPVSSLNAEVSIKMNNIMMQLRKVCNHPYLLEYPLDEFDNYKMDEDLVKKCGKMMILDKMLPELRNRGHKVLIFSQMTKMLDIIEDYLCIRKIEYCRLDGSCKIDDRQQSMEKFNTDPNTWVFLLSTRAGGLGVNLIGADTVIIYDSDWNPQCDLQAQDRCHRIGQTKPVVVYRFVTANTIDQKIVERAAGKRKLEKMVIHKGKFKSGINQDFTSEVKPLCPEELMELLKSKDHCGVVEQGKHGEVLSKEDLDALLDRSDLIEEFNKSKKNKVKQEKEEKQESK